MKDFILGSIIALSLSAPQASAKNITCELRTFSGASEDVVTSWTGYSFIIDTKKSRAKMLESWLGVNARITKKFTTYTSRGTDASMMYDSDNLNLTIAYRIYKTNKCLVRINFGKNYIPMKAMGRVK